VVALRAQTGLTGSARSRTILQREQRQRPDGSNPVTAESQAAPSSVFFAPADWRWRRRSGSEGERAVSAARAAQRAALKPYRKLSSHTRARQGQTEAGKGQTFVEPSQVGSFPTGLATPFARGEDRHLASSYDTRCRRDEGPGSGEYVIPHEEEIRASRTVPVGAPACTTPDETAPQGARESGLVAPARALGRAALCSRATPRGKGGERDD